MLSLEAAHMGPLEGMFQCLYFAIGPNPFFQFIYALLTKGALEKQMVHRFTFQTANWACVNIDDSSKIKAMFCFQTIVERQPCYESISGGTNPAPYYVVPPDSFFSPPKVVVMMVCSSTSLTCP